MQRVAASHAEERPDDPLAKNFKCFKVVVEGEHPPVLSEAEMQEAKEILEKVDAVVSEAPVPTYQDQGNPRGRKPKRGKLEKIKRVAKKGKSEKSEKSKKKKHGKHTRSRKVKGGKKIQKVSATPEEVAETPCRARRSPKTSGRTWC